MLDRIRVRNYQSIRSLDMIPGNFTVLLGESDLGKSAIIRAIGAVIKNQAGATMVTTNEKKAVVTLKFGESEVAWEKSVDTKHTKATVTYYLAKDGTTERFDKSGVSVPDEIQEVLDLGEIEIGGVSLDVNTHNQFNPPFLVSETPAVKAKLLGELSGANVLFLAMQECRRREQQAVRAQTSKLEELEKMSRILLDYEGLDELDVRVRVISERVSDLSQQESEVNRLDSVIVGLIRSRDTINALNRQNSVLGITLDKGTRLKVMMEEKLALERSVKYLQSTVSAIDGLKESMGHLAKNISQFSEELEKIKICPVCGQLLCDKEDLVNHAKSQL